MNIQVWLYNYRLWIKLIKDNENDKKREIPVIGISTEIDIPGRISVKRKYVDAVLQAGGIPLFFRLPTMYRFLQSVVSFIDGLLLTGGGDISPVIYGESTLPECGECCRDRDDFDYACCA